MTYIKDVESNVATYNEDTDHIVIGIGGKDRDNNDVRAILALDEDKAQFLLLDLAKALYDRRQTINEKKMEEIIRNALEGKPSEHVEFVKEETK